MTVAYKISVYIIRTCIPRRVRKKTSFAVCGRWSLRVSRLACTYTPGRRGARKSRSPKSEEQTKNRRQLSHVHTNARAHSIRHSIRSRVQREITVFYLSFFVLLFSTSSDPVTACRETRVSSPRSTTALWCNSTTRSLVPRDPSPDLCKLARADKTYTYTENVYVYRTRKRDGKIIKIRVYKTDIQRLLLYTSRIKYMVFVYFTW